MADLTLKNVIKRYDNNVQTIHGVDLDIKHGEFVVFVGPSGCGKSTLLRMIAGLEEITDGEIHIGSECVNHTPPAQRGIAMVFQSYALYPHMTVKENMALGLKIAKVNRDEIERRVMEAARILKLEKLLDRKPKQLSGGQRQRVAIGRAIVRNPKVFLFDEPLSNLDAELRVEMRVEISKLHEQIGNTMIYVTHDQVEAMTMADKIVVLRDGAIEQVGTPLELYHAPVNRFVAGFIGSPKMNFIPVTVSARGARSLTVTLPDQQTIELPVQGNGVQLGEQITLGVRPEHIFEQGAHDVGIRVRVEVVEHLGGTTFAYADYCGQKGIIIEADGNSRLERHADSQCHFNLEDCHLFDGDGNALTQGKYSQATAA